MIIVDAYVAITLVVLVSVAALVAVAILGVVGVHALIEHRRPHRWLRRAVKARHETSATGQVTLVS